MQIFVSWSKPPSEKVAVLLREWIPNVIQEAELFVSSQDIAKGARGLEAIGRSLNSTDFGIVVLTADNVAAPWINFEAGALSKSLEKSHVIPLLCGIRELDLPNSPLRQFQHAEANEEGILRVLEEINAHCAKPLSVARLQDAFTKWWPEFLASYEKIDLSKPKAVTPVEEDAPYSRLETVLNAILQDMSSLRRQISNQASAIHPGIELVSSPIITRGPMKLSPSEFDDLYNEQRRILNTASTQFVKSRLRAEKKKSVGGSEPTKDEDRER